jgi:hypothetical protein
MRLCSGCGAELQSDARVCGACRQVATGLLEPIGDLAGSAAAIQPAGNLPAREDIASATGAPDHMLLRIGAAAAASVGAVSLTHALANGRRAYSFLAVLALTWLAAGWSLSKGIAALRDGAAAGVAHAHPRSRGRPIGGFLLLLSFGVGAWAILTLHDVWKTLLPIWAGCCALTVVGSLLLGTFEPASGRSKRSGNAWRPTYLLLWAACVLLGVAVRLYRITDLPPGIFVDETNGAMDALMILNGRPDSPFGVGWYEIPSLYPYYMAGIFKLAGVSFATLKVASLVPAVLTVAAIYPLACVLFGPPVGLLATFLLAVSHWHITLSRWGWIELMPPLFQLLSTTLLLRAFASRRAVHYVLAGLLLGLGMYTYLAARLVVGVTAAYILYRTVFERGFLRRHAQGLLLFALAYLLCFGPLCVTYVQNSFTLLNRSREVSILRDVERAGSWSPLLENARRHVLMFHAEGDRNPRHNLPGRPMLSLVPGALLILGLGLAFWRVGDHRFVLLLLWLLITLLGGMLSTVAEGPQAFRTLGVVPAVCLLGAVAADAWFRVVGALRALRPLAALVLFAALGYSAYSTYHAYFLEQAADASVWASFNPGENAVAKRLLAERARAGQLTHVYLPPRLYYFSVIRFLGYSPRADGRGGVEEPEFHLVGPQEDFPLAVDAPRDILLLLDLPIEESLDLIRSYYPHATSKVVTDRGVALYAEIVIPREDISAIQGLTAVDPKGQPLATVALDRHAPVAEWVARLQPGQSLVGALQVPHSGHYAFELRGPVTLEIDGASVAAPRVIGKGLHDIRITRTAGEGAPQIDVQADHAAPQPLNSLALFRRSAPRQGLRGRYYANANWEGVPVFERVDPVLSFSWPGSEPLPEPFSVRWDGQLAIEREGTYAFQLECDDGCALFLDGQPVVSELTGGVHVMQGSRPLHRGLHDITVKYFQGGGGKNLKLAWREPGGSFALVPARLLAPAPSRRRRAPDTAS